MPYWPNMRFWVKSCNFGPFQSLALWGEKVLTFQTWLKKSIITYYGSGWKISTEIIESNQIYLMCELTQNFSFFATFRVSSCKSRIFRPSKLGLKSLSLTSWGQGAKLAWKIPFVGVNMTKCAILALIWSFLAQLESPLGEEKIVSFQT